jgi:hypothetical protein
MEKFFRRGRVEHGEHVGHGGAAEGSPRKSVTGEALRWQRSSNIPVMAVAPVDFGGRRQSLRLHKVYGSELGRSNDDEKLRRAELTVRVASSGCFAKCGNGTAASSHRGEHLVMREIEEVVA